MKEYRIGFIELVDEFVVGWTSLILPGESVHGFFIGSWGIGVSVIEFE